MRTPPVFGGSHGVWRSLSDRKPQSHLGHSLPLTIRNFAFNLWVIKTNAILYDPVFKLHKLWNHNTRDPRVNAVRPAMPLAQSAHKPRYSVKIAVAFVRSCCCYLDHLCYRADWDHRLCDPIVNTSSWNRGYKHRSPSANYFGNPCFNSRTRWFDRPTRDTNPPALNPPPNIGRGRGIDHRPHQRSRTGVGRRKTVKFEDSDPKIVERTVANIEVRIGSLLALGRLARNNLDVHVQAM